MQEVGKEGKAGPNDFVFWSPPGWGGLSGGWGEGQPGTSMVGSSPELPSVPRAAGLAGGEKVKGRFLSDPQCTARAPHRELGGLHCSDAPNMNPANEP